MKVSVLMITYNHEHFIAQALDSVLMQEVEFPYEIVVGEDCSTDATRSILLEYQKLYPDIIRLLLPEKNIGMIPNFINTFKACNGEYIALLEGDDYWISDQKLQKQIDFLESHPSCTICFNPTLVFYDDESASQHVFPAQAEGFYTIVDLLQDNFMHTCSVMCRNIIKEFPPWFYDSVVGDYPLHLLNAGCGDIGCINEVMSAYRIHSSGVWSMQFEKNFKRNIIARIDLYRNVDEFYGKKFRKVIRRRLFMMEFILYKYHQRERLHLESFKCLVKIALKYPVQLLLRKVRGGA